MTLRIGGGVRLGANMNIGGGLDSTIPDGLLSGSATVLNADRGIILDGVTGRVSNWNDQLGSIDCTQATDSAQPDYIAINPQFGGHSSVAGDGSAYWMEIDGYATLMNGDDAETYRVLVLRATQLATLSYVLSVIANDTSTNADYFSTSGSGNFNCSRAADATSVLQSLGPYDTDPHIIELIHTGGTTLTATLDGVVKLDAVAYDTDPLAVPLGTLFGHRFNGSPTGFSATEMTQMIFDPIIPSAGNRTTLRGFLGEIYGISTI